VRLNPSSQNISVEAGRLYIGQKFAEFARPLAKLGATDSDLADAFGCKPLTTGFGQVNISEVCFIPGRFRKL
jgi:hypothetical protein